MGWIFRVFGWDVAGGLKATESDRKERCGDAMNGGQGGGLGGLKWIPYKGRNTFDNWVIGAVRPLESR